MKYNAAPSSCETFTYGEVEDYTVNFTAVANSIMAGINNFSAPSIPHSSVSDQDVKVFPNPVNERFNLIFNDSANIYRKVRMINLQGKELMSIENEFHQTQLTIDMNRYPSGIYFIQLLNGLSTKTMKIIKS